MKHRYLIRLLCGIMMTVATFMTSCSGSSASSLTHEAQEALDAGDPAHARALCDEAMAADDSKKLSASQLAQISLIYMKIADDDVNDDGETVGLAVNAYERAMEISPDSALLYYSSVDYNDTRHVKTLLSVVRGLELPDSCLIDEP